MPFDGNPEETDRLRDNVIARLELLQEIAAKTNGSQNSFRTCLFSEVRRNRALRSLAGTGDLAGNRDGGPDSAAAASNFFGLPDSAAIWSSLGIECKRAIIARRLAALLRRETANAV